MRIKRAQMFMEMAQTVAKRSTCFRLNVGAIAVLNNRPISIGYNGAPSGAPHCSGHDCPGRFYCQETIHAEDNALRHLPDSLDPYTVDMYVTHSPCSKCLEKLEDHPAIRRVLFGEAYRKTEHLEESTLEVYRVLPSGFIVDWATNMLMVEDFI